MKRTKTQKGITLVALIITIIVLLILAVVTIRAVQGDGIIENAENAKDSYISASNKEKDTLSTLLGQIEEGLNVASRTEEGVPIPVGFKYIEGTKDTGLVIENKTEGSQFVWVPVTTDIAAYGLGASGNREPDVVTGVYPSATVDSASGTAYDAQEANLERAGCEDFNKDGKLTASEFKTQLTNEFNKMAASVKKYGGFYVGRYETSINGETVQSKKWTEKNQVTILNNSSTATDWYGQYALCKTYSTSSVQGSIIWGSQYDAMMTWMGNLVTNFDTSKRNSDSQRRTGYVETDVIKKVYDLGGNSHEWTLEATAHTNRVFRGGLKQDAHKPNQRFSYIPTHTDGCYTARLSLYIL